MKTWNSAPAWPWPCREDIRHYLDVPDYYLVGYEEIRGFLRGLNRGRRLSAGTSAGGRDLTVVRYGPERAARSLCVTGGTHGTEVEGVAAVMNVISVLERGHDLRGQRWPGLEAAARSVAFHLMPFYNPDAAARNPVKSYVDMPFDTKHPELDAVNHLHVGFWKNGRTLDRKRVFGPWVKGSDVTDRLDRIGFLGARYNDAGADINRPCTRTRATAVETRQMLPYLRENRVDCYMDLHSHSTAPWLGICPAAHTRGDHAQLLRLQHLTREQTRQAGGPDLALSVQGARSWYNSHFFPANLGVYAFTYEEMAGFRGNFPAETPREAIWLANTYNGMYTIQGLAQALLRVPAVWR